MKKILTFGMAFMILTIMPQISSAQSTPSKEEVKKESKEVKKEIKKTKEVKVEKQVKKEGIQAVEADQQIHTVKKQEIKVEEKEIKKNEPRPFVSEKIEKPKKKKEPKKLHSVSKKQDQ